MRKNKMNKTTRNIALGLAVVSTFALYTPHAWAQVAPTDMPVYKDGAVTSGVSGYNKADIIDPTGSPIMNIKQTPNRAIINWDSFNIGKNGTVNFIQTNGPDAAILNIVNNNKLSEIAGKINANANFALYNPNGMIFYNGSTVNVGGFLATTTEIDTANFMKQDYANDGDLSKLNGSVKFKQNKNTDTETKTKNASIVMDGTVVAQMNSAKFYNDAKNDASNPFHVLGDTAQATTFMPINNKIMLVADGSVHLGSHADLTAVTSTTIGRKYSTGQEQYSVTGKAKSAKGEVILRADANADNYVQNDVNLDGSTTEYELTDKKQAQVTAAGSHVIKSVSVNAYEAAPVLNATESVSTITGGADTTTTYARKDYTAAHATLNVQAAPAMYNTGDKGEYTAIGTTPASSKSYYLVNDIYEIQAIDPAFNTNGNLSGKYAMSDDIKAGATADWISGTGKGFTPLSQTTGAFEFKGTNGILYDTYAASNGIEYPLHKITGLTIEQGTAHDDDATRDNVGFIKNNKGTVMDVAFDTATVTGDEFVGIVAGQNSGTINNVNVSGIVKGHEHVGGLIGKDTSGTLSMVDNAATVTGVDADATKTNNYVGGIAGEGLNTNGSGGDLYNETAIKGNNYVGGLFGKATNVSIGYSSNSGSVDGVDYVGGIAGSATNGSETYNTNSGKITGTGSNTGGLLGESAGSNSIDQSYNSGNVSGNKNVGGLVGNYHSTGKITNSYNGDTISTSISDSGVGTNYDYTIDGMPDVTIPPVDVGGTFEINGVTYTWDGTKYIATVTNNYNSATVFAANTWDATSLSKINNPQEGDQVTGADGTVYTYHTTGAGANRWEATSTIYYEEKTATYDPKTGEILTAAVSAKQMLIYNIKNQDYYGFNYGGKNYKYDAATKMYTEYTYSIDPTTSKPVADATGKTYDEQEMQVLAPTKLRVYTVRPTFAGANVEGKDNTGGLVGYMQSGTIEHAYNVGEITDLNTGTANDTGALIGKKDGGTVASDNVFWVDNTGRAEEDYHMFGSTTAAADYDGNHMSNVLVGIGSEPTDTTSRKIDLNALEEDSDVLTSTTNIETLYEDQITPLLSAFLTTYKFNRELSYNGLTNSLITSDVENLYGAGRFNSSEDGVGRDVLNDAMTIDTPTWVTTPSSQDHPEYQAYSSTLNDDGSTTTHKLYAINVKTITDPSTGKSITTYETTEDANAIGSDGVAAKPIYWKYERSYGTTQANGTTWQYEYSNYSYANSSDLWSPQDAYKASNDNTMHITPKDLTVTVFGEHEYGEDAIKGTNTVANTPNNVDPNTPDKYTVYANILAFNDKFEDVILGKLLYDGKDTSTGLIYSDTTYGTDGNTMNAGDYSFTPAKFSGKTALHNNYAISYVGTLRVNKATLEAAIDDKTKVYGDENPTATGTLTGWKNGESLTNLNNGTVTGGYTYTVDNPLDPDDLTNVGVYKDAIVSGYTFTNYVVVNKPTGTLTITKADLTYTPKDQNRIYGELNDMTSAPDYSKKGTFAGWKGNDKYNDLNNGTVTGSLGLSTSATQTSDTGDYDIVSNGDLDFTNYNVTYNKGTLTIKKADLYFNANGEHYLGNPITMNDINISAVSTAADATASQANDGKLKSWDAISAADLKTLKEYAKDGTDDLVLYMIDKNGNRSLINSMTEVLFDAHNNVIGYKLLDGSFQRADGTYQLVSRNYNMIFKAGDGNDFIVKNPDAPREAAFNAAKYYGDWGNQRRGTIRYLTVKGSGITRK